MQIADLLSPDRVSLESGIASKKRALELLSEALASDDGDGAGLTANQVFDALSAREKLGSTGLGHGVAIPHGRMAEIGNPRVALLRLHEGVDFDAIDHEPVDVLIALIVPEASTSEHLDLLAQLARALSQPDNIAAIRRAADATALYQAATSAFRDA
ncbi:PTS sugar transporter subunit IIA [Thioalkalivibrio sp.]|uniref:PTS sugar transporter subunit IIA n=1 Tax=Thioalkalivibrio sp. TaxID=2093813 RepID=UPI0039768732